MYVRGVMTNGAMSNDMPVRTRIATKQDEPALKALWHIVFGDNPADIDHFFETYFVPDLTVVIDEGGAPVAMAFIVPIGNLVLPQLYKNIGQISASEFEPNRRAVRRYGCAMLYAIGAHPDCRGRGLGAAVTRTAGILAVKNGYGAVVLKPADDGLFDFYERHTGFREFFETCEFELTRDELPQAEQRLKLIPVRPAAYRELRSELLRGAAYIDTDERGLEYQQSLCASAGGGLFALSEGDSGFSAEHIAPVSVAGTRVSFGGSAACAIVETDGDVIRIKELLLEDCDSMMDAVAAVASLFPAERYIVRTPACAGVPDGSSRRFGMIMPAPGLESVRPLQTAKWYGPAFD